MLIISKTHFQQYIPTGIVLRRYVLQRYIITGSGAVKRSRREAKMPNCWRLSRSKVRWQSSIVMPLGSMATLTRILHSDSSFSVNICKSSFLSKRNVLKSILPIPISTNFTQSGRRTLIYVMIGWKTFPMKFPELFFSHSEARFIELSSLEILLSRRLKMSPSWFFLIWWFFFS